jgi:class 3 adenylate cyclase
VPDSDGAEQDLERRLATILSADVAAYSRLMAEDEEQTLRVFRGHKEIFEKLVAAHRGRVFNTAGDAILAEFGSAVEAVRCATEIQAALRTRNDQLPPNRQVQFRIGVNLGDVMVQEQDLLGDGVNVAARLQSAASPGGVCISGSVYDQDSQPPFAVVQAARRHEIQEHSPAGTHLFDRGGRWARRTAVAHRDTRPPRRRPVCEMACPCRCAAVAGGGWRRFLGVLQPPAPRRRGDASGAVGRG